MQPFTLFSPAFLLAKSAVSYGYVIHHVSNKCSNHLILMILEISRRCLLMVRVALQMRETYAIFYSSENFGTNFFQMNVNNLLSPSK